MQDNKPLLFINIGWQLRYRGPASDDPTLGGHGYLQANQVGHEAWNFLPHEGQVYGYIPRETPVRLERLGGSRSDEMLSGVTVVWLARNPHNGRTQIVGWYTDADVYRNSGAIKLYRTGHSVSPQVVAAAGNATLLSKYRRWFPIPTKKEKGCLGQSPVW